MLYNVMKDGKNIFDHPKNSDLKIYENARRIATGQGDDYTTGCLLQQFNKLILQQIQIEMEKQQCSLLLKKQKKLCWTFHKEL